MPPLQGDGKKQAKKPLSSPIQTVLSVLELHQFNQKGSRTLPPIKEFHLAPKY
jgi:hypothetical protein